MRRLAALAARQHGVVARRQLVALGFGRGAIQHALSIGLLHPVHRGVYAVGHRRLSGRGRWMAAVLACGGGAVLSHRSAGALWGFMRVAGARVDVTAPVRGRRTRGGIALHQVRDLHVCDRVVEDGIPVTGVARTLLDVAEVVDRARLERAYDEAVRLRLLDLDDLKLICERSPGRRGLRPLGRLLRDRRVVPETRSELERRFIAVCRRERLSLPVVNALVEGFEVDAHWPGARLVVELDGYAFHRTRMAFERDRLRDARLQLAGYRVVRITHRQLRGEVAAVAELIRGLLAARPTA